MLSPFPWRIPTHPSRSSIKSLFSMKPSPSTRQSSFLPILGHTEICIDHQQFNTHSVHACWLLCTVLGATDTAMNQTLFLPQKQLSRVWLLTPISGRNWQAHFSDPRSKHKGSGSGRTERKREWMQDHLSLSCSKAHFSPTNPRNRGHQSSYN